MNGEQTAAILKELGYNDAEVAAAQEQRSIHCWEPTKAATV